MTFLSRFIEPILTGQKTQTARVSSTAAYGLKKGDIIVAYSKRMALEFARLKVLNIEQRALGTFDDEDAKREGLASLNEFIAVWEQIHPRKGFDPDQTVTVFRFVLE
jgi:hypothetical protein